MSGATGRLALGTAQFGMDYGVANRGGQVDRDEVAAILRHARSVGMDTLDTAIAYGSSEQRLGEIGVAEWRVTSKLPRVPGDAADVAAWVNSAVCESLTRLRVTKLHGLLLHHPQQLLEPTGQALWDALRAAKRDGLVEHIGVSIYDPQELDAICARFRVDIVQAPFNVLDRRLVSSGWLAKLNADGVDVHARSAFLQGLLLMEQGTRPSYFRQWDSLFIEWHDWLRHRQVSAVEACLGFVVAHRDIARIVIGVDTVSQLREIVTAAQGDVGPVPASLSSDDPRLLHPGRWQTQ